MDIKEFNATAVRTEDAQNIYWDVRPFGDRQGEAVDTYLHEVLGAIRMNVGTFNERKLVLITDASAIIPDTARNWLAELQRQGVSADVELRR